MHFCVLDVGAGGQASAECGPRQRQRAVGERTQDRWTETCGHGHLDQSTHTSYTVWKPVHRSTSTSAKALQVSPTWSTAHFRDLRWSKTVEDCKITALQKSFSMWRWTGDRTAAQQNIWMHYKYWPAVLVLCFYI